MRFRIANYINSQPSELEQSEDLVEIYEVAGIDYYIFENNGQLQAAWVNGSYEGCISGAITLSDMKQVIDSIEKG